MFIEKKLEELGFVEEKNYDTSNVSFMLFEQNVSGDTVIVMTRGGNDYVFISARLAESDMGMVPLPVETEEDLREALCPFGGPPPSEDYKLYSEQEDRHEKIRNEAGGTGSRPYSEKNPKPFLTLAEATVTKYGWHTPCEVVKINGTWYLQRTSDRFLLCNDETFRDCDPCPNA